MSASSVDWTRAARGLFWTGIGVLLLLNTQGTLPWSFWLDALAFWPVLLVAGGLRLLFDRSRHPWAALLSPLLILGTLVFVATSTPPGPSGDRLEVFADRPLGTERWTLGGTVTFADLGVKAGAVPEVRLLDGVVTSRGDPAVRTTHSNGEARVRLRGEREWHLIHFPSRGERWELTVADDLPLSIDLDLAANRGELDLGKVPVGRIDLQGACNDLTLRLGVPSNDVRIHLEGALNSLTLIVPRDVPVWTNTEGFLNAVDRERETPIARGAGYRLRMEGAFSRARVRSD